MQISIKNQWLLILFTLPVFCINAQTIKILPNLASPPTNVELFGEGIISTNLYERDMAISPDGKEMFFTLQSNQGKFSSIVYLQKDDKGLWSSPVIASFSGEFSDMEPAFTADGKKLFFVSNRPLAGDSLKDFDIWHVEKINGQWVNPVNPGPPVNTPENEFYPSLASNGNLYFTANYPGGKGKEDIYLAKWEHGHYTRPICLDSGVNSALYEFNAFVSPDEQFIIFTSYGRNDDKGRGDLYISRKSTNGNWQPAKNMALVNSERLDYCPFVSFDQKILFFTSERSSLKEKFGPRPATYDSLAALYNSVTNGQANIYWIRLDQVLKNLR